jgi:RimJ/RimL family protein N-acetyltransferase
MFLKTRRLVIRPFAKMDLHEFRKLLDMPEVPGWRIQRNKAEAFLDWHIGNYSRVDIVHGVVCLGIFDKETGYVLGAVGAGEHDDLHEPEIFFSLLPSARGKGYAVEAAMAVTEWVLDNYDIEYLIGTAEVSNVPSQRVLEKCRYQFIDERDLLVHIENKRHTFKYCKHDNPKAVRRG